MVSFEIVRMNMALDVRRNRIFVPAPIGERLGEEFEFAAWCGKAALDFAVDSYAN